MSCRRVYVIEILEPWIAEVAPGASPSQRCFYVGETGKAAAKRFREHRNPRKAGSRTGPAQVFKTMQKAKGSPLEKKVDVRLRRTLFESIPEVTTTDEAEALEAATVDAMRLQGYIVFPSNVGSVPFDSYKDPGQGDAVAGAVL